MTIEEFRTKKQTILNSGSIKSNKPEMSIDEFKKKKQQILSGVAEQPKTQKNVDEQVSTPQTIQQKIDALWEEEKQTNNNITTVPKSKTPRFHPSHWCKSPVPALHEAFPPERIEEPCNPDRCIAANPLSHFPIGPPPPLAKAETGSRSCLA